MRNSVALCVTVLFIFVLIGIASTNQLYSLVQLISPSNSTNPLKTPTTSFFPISPTIVILLGVGGLITYVLYSYAGDNFRISEGTFLDSNTSETNDETDDETDEDLTEKKVCSYCGREVEPDANGCCPYCGGNPNEGR